MQTDPRRRTFGATPLIQAKSSRSRALRVARPHTITMNRSLLSEFAVSMVKKREQAYLPFSPKAFSVGHLLDAVNRSAGQAICRAQDLDWTNQSRSSTGGTTRTMTRRCSCRAPCDVGFQLAWSCSWINYALRTRWCQGDMSVPIGRRKVTKTSCNLA